MKTLELNQVVFVCTAILVVVAEASRRHVVHGDRSWSATWSWPSDGTAPYQNDFIQDADYNQIADYDTSGNQHEQQYLTGFADNTASLTDEDLIDLLYSRTGRSHATANVDHPTLLERTTYTALNDPEVDDNTQYLSERQQPHQQQIQPHHQHQQDYPLISGYAHTIIH